ncbi:MAG: hypothetical protein GTO45_40310 [Candidatus Aminicenantes bacterium]|nr:hypothetical protein [Candidatus Aminicenantes bacterium]NIM84858.1 hypothetical protein [Candidatus Aminicenantes bacterium]NIN24366.1 hypothetical protein [Candidatus Aminicenantes bacterium]NIN48130.1 hypothetical protein [Candidatus Aminicenantes bacterium]NIN91028.1 hypothetical protein [Candidatus Aminicenantes bacterium]
MAENAWEDYLYWQQTDKKIFKRTNLLIVGMGSGILLPFLLFWSLVTGHCSPLWNPLMRDKIPDTIPNNVFWKY